MPGPRAFPRHERLTRKSEYMAVFEHGRKRVGPAFICYVVRREGQGRKFGFAVSRRVGNAVVRNRVKRLLREFYRAHRARIDENTHVVIVARPAAAAISLEQCSQAMQRLLGEHEVLRG